MRGWLTGGGRGAALARVELSLFLLLWFAYGLAINSGNLRAFNLQQIGVEAIVERRRFFLEGSDVAELQPRGDVFLYGGHKYAAKQPGQFMAGAAVYFPLHAVGVTYARDYLLAAALVTFFTTSLVVAASGVAVFRAARGLARDRSAPFWPLACALVYGLGTTVFSYAGIAHHDALASGYLAVAFCLVFRLARGGLTRHAEVLCAACAGLLTGLAITTSMLIFFMAVVVGVYFLTLRRARLLPALLLGGLLGLLPLFVYDAVNFGNPLLLPNVAGDYRDTFFHLDWANFTAKLVFYLWGLTLYAPVLWLGLAGLWLFPKKFRREQAVLLALVAVLAAYVLNIDTDGQCQYGPRYLLPAMPYLCLGLAGYSHLAAPARKPLLALIILAGLLSLAVNLVGAAHGAMFCTLDRYAFQSHLAEMKGGLWRAYPLAAWLLVPFILSAALFAFSIFATLNRNLSDSQDRQDEREMMNAE